MSAETFAQAWREASALPLPTRYRSTVYLSWNTFRERVESGSPSFATDFVGSILRGDVWLLHRAFDPAWMRSLKDATVAYMRSQPESFHKMLEGSPDFHRQIDLETGKKYSFHCCKHSAYFYRWNSDPLHCWPVVDERWRVVKKAMGLSPDEYVKNTPKDGVVDRIQVVRYPPKIGFLEPHSDPYLHQRLFFSGYMSRRGVDYIGGGFYAVDADDRAVELEQQIMVGDACIGSATVYHGVAPCDRHKMPDWDSNDGRWFLSMYSNASDEVKARHTGHPVKLNIPGVLP